MATVGEKNHMRLWCSGQVKSPHNFGHVFYLYILPFKSLSTYNLIFKLWVTWPARRYLVKPIQLTDYFWSPAGEEPQKSHCWGPFSAHSSPSHRPAHNTISSLITHTLTGVHHVQPHHPACISHYTTLQASNPHCLIHRALIPESHQRWERKLFLTR